MPASPSKALRLEDHLKAAMDWLTRQPEARQAMSEALETFFGFPEAIPTPDGAADDQRDLFRYLEWLLLEHAAPGRAQPSIRCYAETVKRKEQEGLRPLLESRHGAWRVRAAQ